MRENIKKIQPWILLYFIYLSYILIFQNFIIPRLGSLHVGHGILAGDNEIFYNWAINMANEIKVHGLSKWQLFPNNAAGINVSLSSLLFLVFGNHISILAPLNCFLHILSAYILYRFLLELNFTPKSTVFGILCFTFFPTSLIWTSQLHKDLYSILGWFLFFWALVLIQRRKNRLTIFFLVTFSILLFLAVRPMYLNLLLLIILCSFTYMVIVNLNSLKTLKKVIQFYLMGIIPIVLGTFLFYKVGLKNVKDESELIHSYQNIQPQSQSQSQSANQCDPSLWKSSKYLPQIIDKKFETLAFVRKRQICFMPASAKSNTQLDFFPSSTFDIFINLPSSIYTAFFEISPMTVYRIGNIQGYTILPEMLIYYFFLIMLLMYLKKESRLSSFGLFIAPLLAMVILSITTPNLGTLHRVRFPFFILLLSIGSAYFFSTYQSQASKTRN